MYQIGDTIIYTTYGICKVANIVQKEFNGQVTNYYLLTPLVGMKALLQVPVDSPVAKEKLRPILSEHEIYSLIEQIPTVKPYWIDNENERKKHFSNILRCGKRIEVIGIIKSIYEHQKELKERGKKLHACDEQYFKDAEKIIYEEIAYVLNIKKSDVVNFIISNIES
mgnify:CR=1 FL=1